MTSQERSIINSTIAYSRDVRKEYELCDKMEQVIQAAYLSGVLAASMALAMNDGVSISKFAESARTAGEKLLGVKSEPVRPYNPEDDAG